MRCKWSRECVNKLKQTDFMKMNESLQDNEMKSDDKQHFPVSASHRCGSSVCANPVKRIGVFWMSSDRFGVNYLEPPEVSASHAFFVRSSVALGGCLKERGGDGRRELVKGSGRLAWWPICIYFQLPWVNRCSGGCVQSISRSGTDLASPFCTLLSCNLGCLSRSRDETQPLLWLRLQSSSSSSVIRWIREESVCSGQGLVNRNYSLD